VPQDLDQPAAAAAKHKELSAVRIAFELFLHQEGQPSKPRLMSVWPVASHTRTPAGNAINIALNSTVFPMNRATMQSSTNLSKRQFIEMVHSLSDA